MTVKSCILCLPHLKNLTKCKGLISRRKFLKHCPKRIYSVVCEIINFLNRNIKLSAAITNKLKPYKKTMRMLASRLHSYQKKRLITQKGGFLSTLLVPIISILAKVAVENLTE